MSKSRKTAPRRRVRGDDRLAELERRLGEERYARMQSEEERRRLQQALDTMQLGVTISTLSGTILFCNRADATLHGYEPHELIGRDVGIFAPGGCRTPIRPEQLGTVSSWRRERLNVRSDGSLFPVQLLSDVLRNATGEPVGLVTTCEDISARRREAEALREAYLTLDARVAERTAELTALTDCLKKEIAERREGEHERERLEAQLRQAQKLEAIGQLTAGIAHDFNNLLTVILANAELVTLSLPDQIADAAGSAESISKAARSGAALIRKLLAFGRRADLRPEPIDLRTVVCEAASLLRHMISSEIRLDVEANQEVPLVVADAGAINQILLNLVSNARDAMPSGGTIRIEVDEHDSRPVAMRELAAASRSMVRVSVIDTGIGIDEKTKCRIFEPFFTTKSAELGTGLGLSMVYGLMRQHGGFVHVDSTVGTGSRFGLYFPVFAGARCAAGRLDESMTPPAAGRGEAILIADDEQDVVEIARTGLQRLGYVVLSAEDGDAALALFRRHREQIRVIVSDLVMPRLSGRGLLEEIRSEGSTVPFILATGTNVRAPHEMGIASPGVAVLRKPWSLRELAHGVRMALDSYPT